MNSDPPMSNNIVDHGRKIPTLVLLASFIIVIWGLIEAQFFLVPLAFASLLAFLMMPVIRLLQKRRFPEWLIVSITGVLLIAPLALTATFLVKEAHGLVREWPHLEELAVQNVDRLLATSWAQSLSLKDHFDGRELSGQFGHQAGEGMRWAFLSITKVFSIGSHLILILFFAIVMIASREHMRWCLERILKNGDALFSLETFDAATGVLENFLAARMFIIAFVFVADFVILKSFGMNYSTLLSLLLALMTLVPVLGFFVGVGPVILVGLAQGIVPLHLLFIFLCVGSISSFQDHILAPKLIGWRLNLNFLMTYIAIFAGERMWGISGMFLGIPVLGVIRILMSASPRYQEWGNFLQQEDENPKDTLLKDGILKGG